MKILVFSPPQEIQHEVETINELFKTGLEILHLRKPDYTRSRLETLLQKIESAYYSRIMLHTHHNLSEQYELRGLHFPVSARQEASRQLHQHQSTSCHSIDELEACDSHFEYLMVSPVFDSISKPGYYAGIDIGMLEQSISRHGKRVVGLGGVTPENVEQLPKNCWGAAVLGSIWRHDTLRKRRHSFENLLVVSESL